MSDEVSQDASGVPESEYLMREQEKAELIHVLSREGGRAIIWRLLEKAGVFQSGFHGENTHMSAFASGRRDIGLELLNEVLTADPNSYSLMRIENEERRKRRIGKLDG